MSRVLAIGLDVGDGRLLRAFAAGGALPHLAGLLEQGAWAELATPAETLHVSAWPSLYTGASPGRHGVYYTFQPAPGEQGAVRFRPDQYGCPTLWEHAAAEGARCTVFDAPYTNPVEGPTRQVLEWGTWAHYTEPVSAPVDLAGALARSCGRYPLGFEANQIGLAALEAAELGPRLVESASAKGRAVRWLAAAEPWDLFFTVFGETHPAAHYLWPRGLEPSAVEREPQAFAGAREVYAAVDAAIGEILAAANDVDHVLVVSGDGGGPNHAGWHLLPEVLERLGFLVPPGKGGDGDSGPPQKPGLYGRLRGLVPPGLRQSVSRHLPAGVRDKLMKKGAAARLDWSRTRAFCLPTDLEGCVRINLRGREPEGIVAPGELDALCDEIAEKLVELVNPATGKPAVREVVRVSAAFPGERAERLPDLVVAWDDAAPLTELTGPGIGTVSAPSPDGRTGTHRPPGFLLARGPGFTPGAELQGVRVVDFAPTVLHLLGIDPPAHFEGRYLS